MQLPSTADQAAILGDVLKQTIATIGRYRIYAGSPSEAWCDLDWKIDYLSPGCEGIYGYTAEEFMANPALWCSRVHPEDWQAIILPNFALACSSTTQDTTQAEYRIYHKNGSLRWLSETLIFRHDEASNDYIVTGIAIDITERKQAEQQLQQLNATLEAMVIERTAALQDSEECFRSIYEQSPLGISISHLGGELLRVNERLCQLTGYTQAELLGKSYLDLVHPDDRPAATELFQRVLQRDQPQSEIEQRYITKTGAILWVQITRAMLCDRQGHPVGIIGMVQDITTRKRAEADRQTAELAHHQTELQLQRLATYVPGMLYQFKLSTDGSVSFPYASSGCRELYELEPEQLQEDAKQAIAIIHPQDQLAFYQSVALSAQTLQPWEWTGRITTNSGKQKWLHSMSGAERLENGDTIWHGFVLDITERKQLETERKTTEAILHNQEALLDLFFNQSLDGFFIMMLDQPIRWDETTDKDAALEYIFTHKRITRVNNAMLNQYGATQEQFLGLTAADFFAHDMNQGKALWRQLFDSGYIRVESDERKFDGTPIAIEGNYICLYDQEGRIAGHFGVQRDVTERKRLEAEQKRTEVALQQTLQELHYLMENSPLATIRWNRNFQVEHWSKQAEAIFGWQSEEVLGQTMYNWSLIFEADLDIVRQAAVQMLAGASCVVRNRNYRKDGSVAYCEWYNSVLLDESGDVVAILSLAQDVTQRKAAEIALRQSEARYRAIVEDQTEMISRFLPDSTILFVNDAYCRYFGIHHVDIIGKSFNPVVYAADQEQVMQKVQSMSFENPTVMIENRVVVNDEIRWTQWSNRMLFDEQGQFIEYQSVGRDITEVKIAELALQESEVRFRTLAANLPGVIYRCLPQAPWSYLYLSEGIQCLTGYPATAVTTCDYLIHPDDREAATQSVEFALAEKQPFALEYRIHCADGSYKWVYERGQGYWDAQGKCLYLDGVILDISEKVRLETERNAAETARRNSEELLNLFFTQSIEGFFFMMLDEPIHWNETIDKDTTLDYVFTHQHVTRVNDAMLAQYGATQEQFLGWTPVDFFAHDLSQGKMVWRQFFDAGRLHVETEERKLDGTPISIEGDYICLYDKEGRIRGHFGVQRDISEAKRDEVVRKQAEAQLQQINETLAIANAELARANRLKDEFLANMSHELRTPLSSILGLSEVLQLEVFGSLNVKQHQFIDTILSSGNHLLTLINDILDLAKIESGKFELELAPASIQAICETSLTFVKQQAQQKGIVLESRLPPEPMLIQVDERRLRQVLINLLNNGVKFTPEGGRVVLQVETNPIAGSLCFQVIDTGIGIAAADLECLFQPFIQIDSSLSRHYEGTGLGLALVKQIVELHGGEVSVVSELGQGSCFTVKLPWQPERPTTPASP